MAYEARKSRKEQKEINNKNNANLVRNAADVAIASNNPYGVAAGMAVKGVDKVTGGKGSEALGKSLTRATKKVPFGKKAQALSNKFVESGASGEVGKAASMYNGMKGNGNNLLNNSNIKGGGHNSSLPSSDVKKDNLDNKFGNNDTSTNDNSDNNDSKKSKDKFSLQSIKKMGFKVKLILIGVGVFLLLFIITLPIFAVISIFDSNSSYDLYKDEDSKYVSSEQKKFYSNIDNVKYEYLSNGKSFDPQIIVSTFSVLNNYGFSRSYADISESDIREVVDAMYADGSTIYDEVLFKQNLINKIIPKYLNSSESKSKLVAGEILSLVSNYMSVRGKKSESTNCSEAGTCVYNIKGFYKNGNRPEALNLSNVYVQLMQCGGRYGGTWGVALGGEELVPFEKYILGVAYQEIGPSAPEAAFKAQMVAARSYALARHVNNGGWRNLRQEGDKWIIPLASCTEDQVYCNPDLGCSSNDGQWGQVHSGLAYKGFSRKPMDQNSKLRTYAAETSGEVLVNDQGYIIATGFQKGTQHNMVAYAKSGLDYKQVLMKVYNSDMHYGASSIYKANCSGSSSFNCTVSTGEYATWKQKYGSWANIHLGSSSNTIGSSGCLITSIAMQIAKSNTKTNISSFDPGTFVNYLNSYNAFDKYGNFVDYTLVSTVAPAFRYSGQVSLKGYEKNQKLETIKSYVNRPNTYAIAEVKGDTGEHWVAIDSINGDTINMMDPGSTNTNMWVEYPWYNTSRIVYFNVN